MTPAITRILVPLDFSAGSRRALDYAHGLAVKFDAAIHLVHVCEVPSMMTASMDARAIADPDWSQRLGDEAERQLQRESAAVADVRVTTEVLFGNAAKLIIDAAEANQADLIVMGTHGRGAMMHVVMGNVAERVARGAGCPVLTVREPRAHDANTGVVATLAAGVLAAMLLLPAIASAQAAVPRKQSMAGAELYRIYCASCHGTTARGDGPMVSEMRKKPSNLTELAKRNGGMFPSDLVFRTIDGRQPVRGHGGPDMPVWGDAFKRTREEAGDAEGVKAVIQSLVDYLDSIQLRPTHHEQQ